MINLSNYLKMNHERFPSFQEGWLRPQFCLLARFACGDGVVLCLDDHHPAPNLR